MEGGEITGNYSYRNGGGVFGDFTISGGKIQGNTSGDPDPLRKNIYNTPAAEGEDFIIEGWNEPYQLALSEKGDVQGKPVTEVETGSRLEFSAAVTGIGKPSQKVTWSIPEPHNRYTTLKDGALVIGPGENAAALTVRAAAALKHGVYAERAVTVKVYNEPRLRVKFEVNSSGANQVRDVFTAIHNYIQGGQLDAGNPKGLRVGDYYDLPSLVIAADGAAAAVSGNNTFMPDGTGIFRVVVVGINSFKGINGNTASHVVFQFRNAVVSRGMNSDNNGGGYTASEGRAYLTNKFLPGLVAAGVPQDVLWGPNRLIAKVGGGAGTDTVNDLLWLPTALEMNAPVLNELLGNTRYNAGIASAYETQENQALLEYYAAADADSAISLLKRYDMGGKAGIDFWLASPRSGGAFVVLSNLSNASWKPYFTVSAPTYTTTGGTVVRVYGIIPAFCVK